MAFGDNHLRFFSLTGVWFCMRASPVTFSRALRDNVIMVRETLLSNLPPPCDDLTLREHVRHHTPEHLSVSGSSLHAAPLSYGISERKGRSGGGGAHK